MEYCTCMKVGTKVANMSKEHLEITISNAYLKRNLDKALEISLGVTFSWWAIKLLKLISKWGMKDNGQG